ncbi:sensor histidine kinase [Planococcus donghaensis]|uniref:histidine kinase n=1 Tax=Planococcus donghaensis TaxID=414778 RepID=A0A1C7EJL5_9BACL|nr:HAMP domain-containing sensor histidine kinase [Planococcus donghaensis]ANU24243.1 two-component sensor histidine kinase [Planococcus donghaensis]
MFNKLSLKIGMLFFVFILIIQAFLFATLYVTLVNERVDRVLDSLLARGETHSEVLADSFEEVTLKHVGMMEAATNFIVVITDATGEILVNSDALEPEMLEVLEHTDFKKAPTKGEIIEEDWKVKRYIATDSPITIDGQHAGHVFMFAPTGNIDRIVAHLKNQFLLVALVALVLTIITILLLSRFITLPLIRMKEATEQLSQGNNQVDLSNERNDELGELANAITKLSTDLDRLKKARNEFLASISHELRTPLTYIKGYADILGRGDTTEGEREEYLNIIREETAHLTLLIKNLFDLAELDRNQFTIEQRDVSISELLNSVAVLVKPAFADKQLTLSVQCSENFQVFIDSKRIQQVLLNILDNARKHSVAGGSVVIMCAEEEGEIVIRIRDEGQGIPEGELPFVFDRLYRVEKSRSRERGGSGLGLAIAKEIVESHGGQINIDSQAGKGTTVTIRLKRGGDHS